MKINMLNAQKCGNLHWSTQTACFMREMNQNEFGTCEVTHWNLLLNLKGPHLGPPGPQKALILPSRAPKCLQPSIWLVLGMEWIKHCKIHEKWSIGHYFTLKGPHLGPRQALNSPKAPHLTQISLSDPSIALDHLDGKFFSSQKWINPTWIQNSLPHFGTHSPKKPSFCPTMDLLCLLLLWSTQMAKHW